MVTIIVFGIIALLFCIFEIWGDDMASSLFGTIIVNGLMTIVIVSLGLFIGGLVAWALPAKTKPITDTYKIVNLQDNSATQGQFFLGSGYIDGTIKYAFYYKTDNEEGYKLKVINSSNVIIKYSDTVKCLRHRQVKEDSFINWFAFDDLSDELYMTFEIYIPKNSIKQNFVLDAQ